MTLGTSVSGFGVSRGGCRLSGAGCIVKLRGVGYAGPDGKRMAVTAELIHLVTFQRSAAWSGVDSQQRVGRVIRCEAVEKIRSAGRRLAEARVR